MPVATRNLKAFQRRFEREVGKQSAYFRKEFDKWAWVMNNEYEKVLRHIHLIKNVEKMSQGEMFERLMPWLVIAEVGRNILRAAELHMFLRGAEHGMQIAGLGFAFDVNNPLFVEAARLRAASLVKYVSEAARKNLHDMTMQALDAGWSVDTLAVKMRGHLTALPVSQRRIMREATERLASGASQGKVDVWVGREMTRMTNYRAFMIARTESSAAMNDGALMGYKQAGVKMVEWLAQFDACEVCSSFAGELFTVEESFGLMPEHPNCFTSPDTPIYTADGWKPIAKVEVGDLALTHKGRFRKVTQLHRVEKQLPEIVSLRAGGGKYGHAELRGITSNHPVLIDGRWTEVGKAKPGQKIHMLAKKCAGCEKMIPYFRKFCSRSCTSKAITKKQWADPNHRKNVLPKLKKGREKLSRMIKDGIIDTHQLTQAAHDVLRKRIEEGTHPLQLWDRTGDNNPSKRPEVRRKIRESKLGTKNPMHKSKHSDEYWNKVANRVRDYYKKHPEKHPNAILANKARVNDSAKTGIEQIMGIALEDSGLKPDYNHPVGGLWIDYALANDMIAIECDGEYWHKDKQREKKRDEKLCSLGWTVLHFTGAQIKNNVDACVEKVHRVLANHNGEYEFADFQIEEVKVSTRGKRTTTYNLSVDEDESYVAKGFVVHNCLCSWAPQIGTELL